MGKAAGAARWHDPWPCPWWGAGFLLWLGAGGVWRSWRPARLPSTGTARLPGRIQPCVAKTSQGPHPDSASQVLPPRASPPFPKASSEERATPRMQMHEHTRTWTHTRVNTHAQLSPAARRIPRCPRRCCPDPKPSSPTSQALPRLLPSAVAQGCRHQPGRSPAGIPGALGTLRAPRPSCHSSLGTSPKPRQVAPPCSGSQRSLRCWGVLCFPESTLLFPEGYFVVAPAVLETSSPLAPPQGHNRWQAAPPKMGATPDRHKNVAPDACASPPSSDLTPGEPPARTQEERKTFLYAL